MEYYDPIDRSSRRIAIIVTAISVVVALLVVYFVRLKNEGGTWPESELEIVIEEPIEEPEKEPHREQSAPTDQRRDKAPAHVEEAKTESSNQTSGEADKTQTVNPNALFKPVTGNSAEQVPEGNRLAPNGGEEKHKGDGTGYNLQGSDQLDAGLRGRGLREGLPKPSKNYKTDGRVAIYVEIDAAGNVTSAKVQHEGTTTNDEQLRRLAKEAALKAKFRPSERTLQGGVITYVFKLQ